MLHLLLIVIGLAFIALARLTYPSRAEVSALIVLGGLFLFVIWAIGATAGG